MTQYVSPRDECGEGNGTAVQYPHGAHYQSFPVLFSVDNIGEYNFAINTGTQVSHAVINCFMYVNELVGFEFFKYTNNPDNASIKFAFGPLEGTTTGWCSYNYSGSKMKRASIILDSSSRKWFVNPKVQCNDSGSYYDIADVLQHEIGHAIGLAHNTSDSLATMKSGGGRGKTVRRTYSKGERALITKIYGKYASQNPIPTPTPIPTPQPQPQPQPKPETEIEKKVNKIMEFLKLKFPSFPN